MRHSLRTRITLSLITLAVGPLLVIGLVSVIAIFLGQQTGALTLQSEVVQGVSVQVSALIRDRENELRLLHEVVGLQQMDREAQAELLSSLLNYEELFNEVALLDSGGQEILRFSRPEAVTDDTLHDRSKAEEFLQPVASRTVYYGPVEFDELTGEPIMTIALPMENPDTAQVENVLVVDFRFKAIWELIGGLPLSEGESVYIVDPEGRVVAHQDPSVVLQRTQFKVPEQDSPGYTGLNGEETVVAVDRIQLGDQTLVVVAELAQSQVLAPMWQAVGIQAVVILVVFIIATPIAYVAARTSTDPLWKLARAAEAVVSGNLEVDLPVKSEDEYGVLVRAFNRMTAQLRDLVSNLEQRVGERTREMEVMADLGRTITSVRDLDTLLPYTVNLIQERTEHYHVQIFLLDENQQYAVLRASTGEVGGRLLEAGHRLAVGSSSVIGQVTKRGEPVVVQDTESAYAVHKPNPLLPHTRAEMALPLRVEGRVIGALDVQSLEPNAFSDDDVHLFQALADQVAVAIDNAQLFQESAANLRQIEQLTRQLVTEAYDEALRLRRMTTIGYNAAGGYIHEDNQRSHTLTRALSEQTAIVEATPGGRCLALPVMLRGVTIGAVEFELSDETWTEDTPVLAHALVERLADSLETTRLFEQAHRLAARERQVNQVTARLQGESELDEMITVAADEIRRALQARRAAVRLEIE